MVNDWLKFAEAKNAGLLGLNGLGLTALLGFATQVEKLDAWPNYLLVASTVAWILSVLALVLSFLPKLNTKFLLDKGGREIQNLDNLFFFGHLARLDPAALLKELGLQSEQQSSRHRFEHDLAKQVVTNSRIANGKLRAFTIAAVLWLIGVTCTAIGVAFAL
jgi:hypothetical protein